MYFGVQIHINYMFNSRCIYSTFSVLNVCFLISYSVITEADKTISTKRANAQTIHIQNNARKVMVMVIKTNLFEQIKHSGSYQHANFGSSYLYKFKTASEKMPM